MHNKDFYLDVQEGNVEGYSIIHKFGGNADILNGVWSLVSSSSPSGAFPVSGDVVRIKAGGDAADSASGVGARSITLTGINSDLEEITETLITSGVNASAYSVNNFWRIYRAYVSSAGEYGGANIDNITIENSQDMIRIRADEGQTQHAAYAIPINKTGYLLGVHLTVDAVKAADCRMFIRKNFTDIVVPTSSKRLLLYWNGVLGQATHLPGIPCVKFDALTDIWVEARGGGANTEVSADFEILLVDNPSGPIQQI